MKTIAKLRSAGSRHDLSILLGIPLKDLTYFAYGLNETAKYASFSIPKKLGGARDISMPVGAFANIQKRISKLLSDCAANIEEEKGVVAPHTYAQGFMRRRSIITNAKRHTNKRWVFNVDVEDFFPSINFGRVRGHFLKSRSFKLHHDVATTLAQLTTFSGGLPQGSPSSPIVSNLVCQPLDYRLGRLAAANRCTYTRYADDITFSTNKALFPNDIAALDALGQWEVGVALSDQLRNCGFKINVAKTRQQYYWSRQIVTGLTVNKLVNVDSRFIKDTRAQVDSFISTGTCYVSGTKKSIPLSTPKLQGRLSHIYNVKASMISYSRPSRPQLEPAWLKTHRKYLDFASFASTPGPVLITEGKSDAMYIRAAILRLSHLHPSLLAPTAAARLRLYRYTQMGDVVQSLGGGTGDLKKFVAGYRDRVGRFSTASLDHPVIILVDNDKGGREVFAAGKMAGGLAVIDGSLPFYRILENLYLCSIPITGGASSSCVEDCLSPRQKAVVLSGKTFHPDGAGFDPSNHFGKARLAERVLKNWKKHSFSGFIPIINTFRDIIADYESLKAAPT